MLLQLMLQQLLMLLRWNRLRQLDPLKILSQLLLKLFLL
jgi:hypothetical protein